MTSSSSRSNVAFIPQYGYCIRREGLEGSHAHLTWLSSVLQYFLLGLSKTSLLVGAVSSDSRAFGVRSSDDLKIFSAIWNFLETSRDFFITSTSTREGSKDHKDLGFRYCLRTAPGPNCVELNCGECVGKEEYLCNSNV